MVSCMPERMPSPILLSRSSYPPWAMPLPLPCVSSQRLHVFNPVVSLDSGVALAVEAAKKVVQAMNGDGARLFFLPALVFNLRRGALRDILVF